MDKLSNSYKQILQPMEIVREYCRLGNKLRQIHNIPVSYPLYEMRINVLELPYCKEDGLTLLKDERQLIADELNIEWVEPIYHAPWSKHAGVVELEEGNYKVAVDITKDHYLDRKYKQRKEKREEAELRKKQNLSYVTR